MTCMYFIAASNADGESLDWFVEADSPGHALALWHRMDFEIEPDGEINIFRVPAVTGKAHALLWHSEVKNVGTLECCL